jgi:hypothetical protein
MLIGIIIPVAVEALLCCGKNCLKKYCKPGTTYRHRNAHDDMDYEHAEGQVRQRC